MSTNKTQSVVGSLKQSKPLKGVISSSVSINGAIRSNASINGNTNVGSTLKVPGIDGATFTPSVDEDGNLSWTNDCGLPNPESVNIQGPKGETGPQGEKGDAFTYDNFTPEQLESLKGPKGDKGDPGQNGKDGNPGKDGSPGKDGADGKTPVKGTDYFTEADKAEMVSAVISALPVYNGEVGAV